MTEVIKPWKSAGADAKAVEISTSRNPDGQAVVSAKIAIPVGASSANLTYTIDAAGTIRVEGSVALDAPRPADEVARIGFRAGLVPSLDQVEWYGLGPAETYPDRKSSGLVGLWRANARDWNHNYTLPQETGHRCDVRFAKITDAAGGGLCVVADRNLFGMNLWPWMPEAMEEATYPYQLQSAESLTLVIDMFQMGLGGTFGWGGRPLDVYRLKTGRTYDLGFVLQPKNKPRCFGTIASAVNSFAVQLTREEEAGKI
jgi:beta-galactosidase